MTKAYKQGMIVGLEGYQSQWESRNPYKKSTREGKEWEEAMKLGREYRCHQGAEAANDKAKEWSKL